MKRFLALVLALCLTGSLCACAAAPAAAPAAPAEAAAEETAAEEPAAEEPAAETTATDPKDEEKTIVFLARDMSDMYCTFLVSMSKKVISEQYPNWKLEVIDLAGDPSKNIEGIENAVAMGADAIYGQLSNVNPESAARQAGKEGVPVIAIDAVYEESIGKLAMVNVDNYDMGYLIGELAAEKLPENAKVAILSIARSYPVVLDRDQGIADGIAKTRDDVEIVDIGDINFDKNVGIQITTDWITQYGQLDGILGDSDTCALAAIEAYRAAGLDLDKTIFIGLDGGSDACYSISKGEMTGSVLQSAEEYVKECLALSYKYFTGELDPASETDQPNISLKPVMITADNVDEYIELYKEYGLMQ